MESKDSNKKRINTKNLNEVEKIISEMKFGSVTLIVQDGIIIQIEKNEKIRLR